MQGQMFVVGQIRVVGAMVTPSIMERGMGGSHGNLLMIYSPLHSYIPLCDTLSFSLVSLSLYTCVYYTLLVNEYTVSLYDMPLTIDEWGPFIIQVATVHYSSA